MTKPPWRVQALFVGTSNRSVGSRPFFPELPISRTAAPGSRSYGDNRFMPGEKRGQ